jgi:succinoglycan biosynthesis transport protein ExoP
MEAEKVFEFSDYLQALRQRRHLMVAIWLPLVLGALLLAVALPSVYVSTATFQLKETPTEQAKGDNYADRYVSGLTASVLSSSQLHDAIGTLRPYPQLGGDNASALRKLKADVSVQMVTQKILDPQSGLERNLNTGFTVSYDNRDPQRAHDVAAWLADAFVAESRRNAIAQAANEAKFYAAEADRERAKITESEARLAKFKQENFDRLPDAAQANLNVKNAADQELEGVDRDVRTLQQNRVFIMQQLQQARATGTNADAVRDLEADYKKKAAVYDENHPDMIAMRRQLDSLRRGDAIGAGSSLKAQLTAQQGILTETRQRYSEDHPDVKRLERSISALQARIAAGETSESSDAGARTPAVFQLETQLNGTDTQISALERRREELRGKLLSLQGRLQSTPEVERAYDTLNRDAGTARQQYDQLINKRMGSEVNEAAIANGTVDQFEVVGAASLPRTPSKPLRVGIAVIGLIGGTLLALMAALGATAVDSTIRGTRDLQRLLAVSPIGIVPYIRNAEFHRRRGRQITGLAAAVLLAVPACYFLIRMLAR